MDLLCHTNLIKKTKHFGRHYANYTEENLTKAIEERLKGKSLHYISKKYNIPKSIIDNKPPKKHEAIFG